MRDPADVPVLLVLFNRPDQTRRMITALRDVRPRRLFVAADGPRPGVRSDADRCAGARDVLAEIDWPCELRTQFQVRNLGCKTGPETAITWFFSHVEDGIILEDDCIPTPDFFPFCAELLDVYAATDDVMMISGHNPLGVWSRSGSSYVFTRTSPTWGWATWRRAWQHYEPTMAAWERAGTRRAVRRRMPAAEFRLTRRRFDQVHGKGLDAWDFAWAFAMLQRDAVAVMSASNVICNIGFGEDATHTKNVLSPDSRETTTPIRFPLVHPRSTEPEVDLEKALFARRFPLTRRFLTILPPALGDAVRAALYRATALWTTVSGPVGSASSRR